MRTFCVALALAVASCSIAAIAYDVVSYDTMRALVYMAAASLLLAVAALARWCIVDLRSKT